MCSPLQEGQDGNLGVRKSQKESVCNPPLLAATLWTYGMSKTRFLQTQKKDEDHELHTLEEHVLSVLLGDE